MSRIKSLDELLKTKEKAKENILFRTTSEKPDRTVVLVGMGTCGIAAGARMILNVLLEEVQKNKLEDVSVIAAAKRWVESDDPIVEVKLPNAEPVRYGKVDENKAREIITKHVMQGIVLANPLADREV